ncbi:MAG: metal-dependent hydrolase [Lentisphaerota bacterium]
MKGISHFISGVAAASFCPWTVQAAQDGNPLFFLLGGIFGILPDTLDFKFYRFFYHHDIYVEPDSPKPDPQFIADALASGVNRAFEEKKTIRIKLSTIRVGADYWQQYMVKFDVKKQEVQVKFGPVVNTGQVPIPSSAPLERVVGRAALKCPVVQTYESVTKVDIFDGPSFAMEPDAEGRVLLHFLPWHRNWSHSLVVGGIFALMGWLVWSWQAAAVIMLGYSVHVLEDQLGHMGSNLIFPLRLKGRSPGLQWMHSGDSIPNFATVWTCCLLIFWNLYYYAPNPQYHFTFLKLVLYGAVIPMGLYGFLHYLLTRGVEEEAGDDKEKSDEWGDDPMLS